MKLKQYQCYYCNNCHKLYVYDDEWCENFVRLGKTEKITPLICSHCRFLQSSSSTQVLEHEIQIMHEAYRILKMNTNKENLK
jgi:hypothetical protein